MSYATVAEADGALGHLTAWSSLDEPTRQARLDGARIWLDAGYVTLDGQPLGAAMDALDTVPLAVKRAEIEVARHALFVPLYATHGQAAQGALIREERKLDVIETKRTWAEPVAEPNARREIGEVDDLLVGIAVRVGASRPRPAVFLV